MGVFIGTFFGTSSPFAMVWSIYLILWLIICLLNVLFIISALFYERKIIKRIISFADIKFLFLSSVYKLFKFYLGKDNPNNIGLSVIKKTIRYSLILIGCLMILIFILAVTGNLHN